MIIYWSLLFVPILAFLTPVKMSKSLHKLHWLAYGCFLIIAIGLRHEVGGDWVHYLHDNGLYNSLADLPFWELFTLNNLAHDIGFLLVHWFSQNWFDGIYTTNLICAGIFTAGLLRLCKSMPTPWLALSIATPYLIIVVAMGYTRQATALGFVMWGLVDLMDNKKGKFYLSVVLAVLFHKTALIMMLIGSLYQSGSNRKWGKKDYLIFAIAIAFVAAIYHIFEHMVYHYITNTKMSSSGALIRVSMSVVAAVVFLAFRRQWEDVYGDSRLWKNFSIAILSLLPLVFILSTTVDRIALYLLPMQIVIFSRVVTLAMEENTRYLLVTGILSMYVLVLYVWLNYGVHATYWLPYDNILLL